MRNKGNNFSTYNLNPIFIQESWPLSHLVLESTENSGLVLLSLVRIFCHERRAFKVQLFLLFRLSSLPFSNWIGPRHEVDDLWLVSKRQPLPNQGHFVFVDNLNMHDSILDKSPVVYNYILRFDVVFTDKSFENLIGVFVPILAIFLWVSHTCITLL